MTVTGASSPAARGDSRSRAVDALEVSFTELTEKLRRFYARAAEAASPGMLPGTFKVLAAVARTGPIPLSQLAERLVADKGMVSRQVTQLEALGLIARSPDASDARVRLIEVTELGRERLSAAHQPYEELLNGALKDWPIAAIDNLASLVHALAAGEIPDHDA